MKKLRVYELAKELNVDARILLTFLKGRGSAASSTLSMVELDKEELARQHFGKGSTIPPGGARLVGRVQREPARPAASAPQAETKATPAPAATAPGTAGRPGASPAAQAPRAASAGPAPAPAAQAVPRAAAPGQAEASRPSSQVAATPAKGTAAAAKAAPAPAASHPGQPATRPGAAVKPPARAAQKAPAPAQAGKAAAVATPARAAAPAPKAGQPAPKASAPPARPAAGRPAAARPAAAVATRPKHEKPAPGAAEARAAKQERRQPPRPVRPAARPGPAAPAPPQPPRGGVVELPQRIVVRDLASRLGVSAAELIKQLMKQNVMATITQEIPFEVAAAVAERFGFSVQRPKTSEERFLEEMQQAASQPARLEPRPPVVTIMGHVDHGKTTLLDVIRQSRVAAQEYGGITQHIGAYQVEVQGRLITFLDTPGHEAFTAMRARGAQVTDIAVLVVAADDGVMPQTIEAINHARAADVPIIVAINKIDKPTANPDRVKQQLAEHGLVPEEWGGDTVMVPVSALKKEGIEELLEMILLVADLRELKAPIDRPASGVVIEAQLDRGRGPVATVLVKEGVLKVGDPIIVGAVPGRVRALMDDKGRQRQEAGPSTPIVVLGLHDVPQPGDVLMVTPDEETARRIAEERLQKQRAEQLRPAARMTLESLSRMAAEGEARELNIVLKADVQGSLEALQQALEQLSSDEVQVNVIHAAVGGISETDVNLAAASNAIIVGFNVRPDANARRAAERDQVDIRTYRIIYEVVDDVKAAMQGMLKPRIEERVLGRAEVRRTFKVPGVGVVAGCYVTDGRATRNASVRVLRDDVVVYEGRVASLKRFKDDVREVAAGYECGIGIERFNDIKEGDVLEFYELAEVSPTAQAVGAANRAGS